MKQNTKDLLAAFGGAAAAIAVDASLLSQTLSFSDIFGTALLGGLGGTLLGNRDFRNSFFHSPRSAPTPR